MSAAEWWCLPASFVLRAIGACQRFLLQRCNQLSWHFDTLAQMWWHSWKETAFSKLVDPWKTWWETDKTTTYFQRVVFSLPRMHALVPGCWIKACWAAHRSDLHKHVERLRSKTNHCCIGSDVLYDAAYQCSSSASPRARHHLHFIGKCFLSTTSDGCQIRPNLSQAEINTVPLQQSPLYISKYWCLIDFQTYQVNVPLTEA